MTRMIKPPRNLSFICPPRFKSTQLYSFNIHANQLILYFSNLEYISPLSIRRIHRGPREDCATSSHGLACIRRIPKSNWYKARANGGRHLQSILCHSLTGRRRRTDKGWPGNSSKSSTCEKHYQTKFNYSK